MSFGLRDEDWVNPPEDDFDNLRCEDCLHSFENVNGELMCEALYIRQMRKYSNANRNAHEYIVNAGEPCELYEERD